MKFEASTHTLAYLGNEDQFPQDVDMLGIAIESILQTGHEVKVPHIWVQEDIISMYGLHEVLLPGETSIDKLTHDSTPDLADLIISRWHMLPDQLLASHEIHARSSMLDIEISGVHNKYFSEGIQDAMRNGIASALAIKFGGIALIHGSSEAIVATSIIYNDALIPAARQQEAYRNN